MVRVFYLLFTLLAVFTVQVVMGQAQNAALAGDTLPFNYAYWNGVADKQHLTVEERAEMIAVQRKIFDEQRAHSHIDKDNILWVTEPVAAGKGSGQNEVFAGPCTNIDFENGTMAGWVRSTGYNPLTNVMGCCPNPNGDQTIMTGGNDPFGLFPRVYPGGGNFSLRLGSTATGGIADRISQTFFVTAANANFTYRYALVLNDGGHQPAEQPRFTSEIIDSLGNPVPCTFYQVSAGSNSTGIVASTLTPANGSPVSYKNWTNVLVDLTPNIGQNVTMRFTVYDCGPSGHFAYAYIDGSCTNFATSVADTTCPNVPVTMCAPPGLLSTTWNGPGIVTNTNTCISAVVPGTYTCTTVLVPGCPGPTFTHTLTLRPNPVISFTPVSAGPCLTQYTFNPSMSIASGSIASFRWYFGDGNTSTSSNPVHNFGAPGTYQVKLRVVSNKGCVDSLVSPITIFPFPVLAFSPPSNCINTVIQFTNTSAVAVGSISSYTWNLGNGVGSNLVNPTNTYSTNGTYTITLNALSNMGCPASLTQTLGIFPPPIVSFSASPLCDINGTSFSPATSTAIASGSLSAFLWDFGDGGTSNQANPVHVYNAPGAYTVNFTAWSNHNCMATASNSFQISPSPTVAFVTTSVNACSPNFTFANTSSISAGPISYTWNLGGGITTTNTSLTYTFPAIGDYTVSLIGTSNMGCTDTMYNYISVYPYPVVNLAVPASCEKAIFTVTTTAVSGSVTSYLWNFGDPGSGAANTSSVQNATHFYATTGIYPISLNILSNLNCPTTILDTIFVYPNPVAQFNYTTATGCSLPYTYINTSTVLNVNNDYIALNYWNIGGIGFSLLPPPFNFNFGGPGNYSVSLIVTTNHNCSDTMSVNIQVHPLPQLAFTALSSCQNQPVNFLGSASVPTIPLVPPGSINSYTWNFGDNTFTNSVNPPPHTYPAAGDYTITFGATSNMNCLSTLTKTLTIYPAAVSDFTAGSFCLGAPTLFTSTNTVASGTLFAHNWNFGDGTFGSNPVVTHVYANTGSYPVSFSVTTNNECLTVINKTVNIYPNPVASFTVNGGCLNTLSQFAETSTISAGSISTYTWNFGDGNNSTNQSPAHTYTVFGTYTPTLTVGSDQTCLASATNTVVIHPLPVVTFSPPSACAGTVVQFTNTSSIPLGSVTSYTWDFADGSPATNVLNPAHTYTLANTYSVLLTAVSNQGCVKTGTNVLLIHPIPTATITPIFNSCINDAAYINTNLSITSGSIASYTVTYGDAGSNVFLSPITQYNSTHTHTYTAYNTYSLTLTVNSDKNCGITVTDSIKIYPKPLVNFTPDNVCYGETIVFNNLSNIPSPGTYSINAHLWQFNDGSATPTSTLANPTHLFPGPNTFTIYNVKLTEFSFPEAQNLTSTLTCSASAVKSITVFPTPVPSFTNNTACEGTITNFTNTTNATDIVGWSWHYYNISQLNSVAQHPSTTYSAAGIYTTQLIALNTYGCRDTLLRQVEVYANPTASFVSDSACLKTLTTFTNTSTHGSGSTSQYTWSVVGGGSFSFNNSPPTYSFNASGAHFIKLTAKSDLGCMGTFTAPVIVHPLPKVKFTATEVCLGKPSAFTNLTTGGITYAWDFGEPSSGPNNTSNAINPVHIYSSNGGFSAKLTATSPDNCTSDTTISLIVHRNPLADFVAKSLCEGDPAEFINLSASTDGTLALHYWDFNNDNVTDQAAKTPTYTYATSGNHVTRLTVATQYGCVDSTSKTIFVNPKAVPEISSNNKKGCPPLCVSFQNTSTLSVGTYSMEWDFGDGDATEGNVQNPVRCFDAGSYDLTLSLVTDMGCRSRLHYPGFVTVYPNPVASFVTSPDLVPEDEPVIQIHSTASPDVVFTRYTINDGTSYSKPNVTHILKNLDGAVKPIVVQVVKNAYNCADTTYRLIEMKPAWSLYIPNTFTPNGDGINDMFQAKGIGIIDFSMQIFDRWGHRVFETKNIEEPWDGVHRSGGDTKQDVYIWKAQVTDVLFQKHYLTGHVNLLR